jgi:hypothetical protein
MATNQNYAKEEIKSREKVREACCVKHTKLILPVVLYTREIWSLWRRQNSDANTWI